MRITNINLANFRAFAAPPAGIDIPLPKGENLLVYGENGAGKSSLFLALKNFFEASQSDKEFANFQNRFHQKPKGFVRLNFSECEAEVGWPMLGWIWGGEGDYDGFPDVADHQGLALREANLCKGFIDYKALLQTYFLPREGGEINFFPLLIGDYAASPTNDERFWGTKYFGLLGNVTNAVTGTRFFADWANLCDFIASPRRNSQQQKINDLLPKFNLGLRAELEEVGELASTYLQFFGYQIKFEFEFGGLAMKERVKVPTDDFIRLHLEYFDKTISNHHEFLNEAKLSALALSIFLAAHKRQPAGSIKVMAFDDVLIGLDMSNRLPFLDLLKEHFSDYQIILTTYDRAWFEIVRARTMQGDWPHNWKTIEMFVGKADDFESPVVKTDEKTLLQLANEFFEAHLYKAAAVYARTHFEHLLKGYCSEKGLAVKYHENPKKISSNDFWSAIKSKQATEYELVERRNGKGDLVKTEKKAYQVPLVGADLVRQVEEARDLFLNPLSHSNIVNPIASEIKKALETIEALEKRLADA